MKYSKDFSLIVPTRNNLSGLIKMIDSFMETAHNSECVEFLLAPDIDDPQLKEIKHRLWNYPVRVYETHQSDNFCRDYFNFLAYKAKGRSVWCMNDDVVMETEGWDTIINEKIKDKKLYLVDTWDSTHEFEGTSFPRFPIISKEAIDTIGFVFYPQCRMWPADRLIYELYKMADLIVECHEVKFQHNHIANNDPSKSRLYNIFLEDKANGVFPINVFHEKQLLINKKEI